MSWEDKESKKMSFGALLVIALLACSVVPILLWLYKHAVNWIK